MVAAVPSASQASAGMAARTTDVVIVGAGVMGCALGWRLRKAGLSVRLLERSVPGAEASSVAAGILAPHLERSSGALLELGRLGLTLHAGWANELKDAVGLDVGHRRSGALALALDEGELVSLRERAAVLSPTTTVELLDGARARELEPALTSDVRGALFVPGEAQVEPPLLVRALSLAAERAGAEFSSGTPVREIAIRHERATGVVLADGSEVSAGHVVVAAGAWTSLVPGLGALGRAVTPVRGQLVHAELRRPILSRIVFGAGGYVVPRADGRVVCGATMEDVGFTSEVTLGGMHAVLSSALRAVPGLGAARVTSQAVSFRPASKDELPLIGPAGAEGLWLATGHFRNGILLAPATAEALTDRLVGRAASFDLSPFDPRRLVS